VTNHFALELITHLTGDVENCAPVFCSAEGRGSCHKNVHDLEINGKGFYLTSVLRHEIYVDRRFGTTFRSKMTSIGCPEPSVRNYRYTLCNSPEGVQFSGKYCLFHAADCRRAAYNCSVRNVSSDRVVLKLRSGRAITGLEHRPSLYVYNQYC
jgi:hypothetical protein